MGHVYQGIGMGSGTVMYEYEKYEDGYGGWVVWLMAYGLWLMVV